MRFVPLDAERHLDHAVVLRADHAVHLEADGRAGIGATADSMFARPTNRSPVCANSTTASSV
jgi:hypothetical protein